MCRSQRNNVILPTKQTLDRIAGSMLQVNGKKIHVYIFLKYKLYIEPYIVDRNQSNEWSTDGCKNRMKIVLHTPQSCSKTLMQEYFGHETKFFSNTKIEEKWFYSSWAEVLRSNSIHVS